jgi:hypothetical protein
MTSNKKLAAQNQVLKNIIKAKGIDIKSKVSEDKNNHKNIDSLIAKDLKFTFLYILLSCGLLFAIKTLNLNLFLNKFF